MRAANLNLETFYYVRAANLILDILMLSCPPAATFYPFFNQIIDLFLIQFVLPFSFISLFNQETGWVSSLYYFHPLSFLFVPSPMYILNSPTPTLFLV